MPDFISKYSFLFLLCPSFSCFFSYFLSILSLSLVKTFIFIVYVCLRLFSIFFAWLSLSRDFGLSSYSSTPKRLSLITQSNIAHSYPLSNLLSFFILLYSITHYLELYSSSYILISLIFNCHLSPPVCKLLKAETCLLTEGIKSLL